MDSRATQYGKKSYRQQAKGFAFFFTSDVITIIFFLVAIKCVQNITFSIQREHELDWVEGQSYENKKRH